MNQISLQTRRGQVLAGGLAFGVLVLLWFGAVAPVWRWFDAREVVRLQRQALLRHMRDAAETLPQLQDVLSQACSDGGLGTMALLPSENDSLAAADLLERVQTVATAVGVSLAAIEMRPTAAAQYWHKVPLRLGLKASWPMLIAFLRSLQDLPIRLFVDDIHIHSSAAIAHSSDPPIQASMEIHGFSKQSREACCINDGSGADAHARSACPDEAAGNQTIQRHPGG